MILWKFVISTCTVLGTGLVILLMFLLATHSRRHELEIAAELELEEMRAQNGWYGKISFLRRNETFEEKMRQDREETEAGKKLVRIEKIGGWITTVGMVLALIASLIYWNMN